MLVIEVEDSPVAMIMAAATRLGVAKPSVFAGHEAGISCPRATGSQPRRPPPEEDDAYAHM